MLSLAFVAITEQVAGPLALNLPLEILQSVPVTAKETEPVPEPPDEVNVTSVPTLFVVVALETTSVA